MSLCLYYHNLNMALDFTTDINRDYTEAMDYPRTDRLMVKILWWHLGFFTVTALLNSVFRVADKYPSPLSWRVISLQEAAIALAIAAAATIIPYLLRGKLKNHYAWRMLVTTCLTIFSYLFVFISGGSIEMHFHFFMMISLLIIYADWRLGWILLVLTGLHHGILNYLQPGWVYFYGRNDFAVIAHALPVLAAVIFTTIITYNSRNVLVGLDEAKKSLESTVARKTEELRTANQSLEQKVNERTAQLQDNLDEVQKLNDVMVGRELKMAEQKEEIARLRQPSNDQPASD